MKAVFLDYTGTMVRDDDEYTRGLVGYFMEHSELKSVPEVLRVVWKLIKETEAGSVGDDFVLAGSVGDDFVLNHKKVDIVLDYCENNHGFTGDRGYVHEIWEKVWVYAPLYDDVKPFFDRMDIPIYIFSNDDLKYLEESMSIKGLKPAGIISAEVAKACKPNRLIFEKGLEIAGVKPEEAVLIGDSMVSDIIPAKNIGITAIYIDRKGTAPAEGVRTVRSLDEIF